MDEFERLAFRRFGNGDRLRQVLRLLADRNLRKIRKAGVVSGRVDDHRIAGGLAALLLQRGRKRLQGRNQRLIGGVPVRGALGGDDRLRGQRDLLAEGVGGLNRRWGRRRRRGGRQISRGFRLGRRRGRGRGRSRRCGRGRLRASWVKCNGDRRDQGQQGDAK